MDNLFASTARRVQGQTASPLRQRGISTLAITLILLGVVTVIVLFATSVAFFEQRTTTNQNRAMSAEQMAEFAVNLSGQWLNANRSVIVKSTAGGWLAPGTERWLPCPSAPAAGHPCLAEANTTRRSAMYYYDGDASSGAVDPIPYLSLAGALTSGSLTGGTAGARFAGTTRVDALLCRIGFSAANPTQPECQLTPANPANVAITLVATSAMGGESASATVKETWATAIQASPSAPVPLIASGLVEGLGNAQIVAAPNAGGPGVAGSIWSPRDVDIGSSSGSCGGGGLGSVSTCHVGEYLQGVPRENLKTTCATTNSCGCPSLTAGSSGSLSGHSGSFRRENLDILDIDGNCGAIPDVTFFPREPYDNPSDPTDDSLFEFIFDVDYVVAEGGSSVLSNCGSSGTQNCAAFALTEEYNATVLSDCSTLNSSSSGFFYVTGNCDLGSFGSPTSPLILVVDGTASVNGNAVFYGMLFVRSNDNTAQLRGNGNVKVFGSVVVEGNVNVTGGIDIVYDNTSAASNGEFPNSAKFGRVSGSWLDSRQGF